VCLSANKDTTWVIGSVAMDHLVKENIHFINEYKLSIPTKIHIANNLLSVSKLEKKGLVITIKNAGAEVGKDGTVTGLANRKGNLCKMNMIMKKTDDSRAYSAVTMNNSKVSHTRMRHEGNNQFQQSAKTVDRMNVNKDSDVTEVSVNGKQTQVLHKQTKVNTGRPLERIHSNVSNGYRKIKYRTGIITQIWRARKQKEKDTYCHDAQENELKQRKWYDSIKLHTCGGWGR
jgi:hypothetical protein